MDTKYINAFSQGIKEFMKSECNIQIAKEEITLNIDMIQIQETGVIIGLAGCITGQIVYSFTEEAAKKIIEKWLSKYKKPDVKKMFRSSLSEIASIITGRSLILIKEKCQDTLDESIIYASMPSVIIGEKITIDFIKVEAISLLLSTDIAEIAVNIAINEKY